MSEHTAVTCFIRGHLARYDNEAELWRDDNGAPADVDRPCAHCHQPPTPEGHDPCLGTLPGVVSACCGHGVEDAYVVTSDGACHPMAVAVRVVLDCPECERPRAVRVTRAQKRAARAMVRRWLNKEIKPRLTVQKIADARPAPPHRPPPLSRPRTADRGWTDE